MEINELFDRKNREIVFDNENKKNKLGTLTYEVNSIQTYFLQVQWKQLDHELYFSHPDFVKDASDPLQVKRVSQHSKSRRLLYQIITVIIITLFFQVISILCLELNVQIVKEYESESDVKKALDFSSKVYPLNDFMHSKKNLKVNLSDFYKSPEGVEMPLAQVYDYFQTVKDLVQETSNVLPNLENNGLWLQVPVEHQFPICTLTEWSNHARLVGDWTGSTVIQPLPMLLKDHQDWQALKLTNRTEYEYYFNKLLNSDLKHLLYDTLSFNTDNDNRKDMYSWNQNLEISDTFHKSKFYYQDISRLEDDINQQKEDGNINNFLCGDVDVSSAQASIELDLDPWTNTQVNPTICNVQCRDYNQATMYTLSFSFSDYSYKCHCFINEPTITNTNQESFQSCLGIQDFFFGQGGIPTTRQIIKEILPQFQQETNSLLLFTKQNYFDVRIDYKDNQNEVIQKRRMLYMYEMDKTMQTVNKEYYNRLTGSFIKPLIFKKFKICRYDSSDASDQSIDFGGDLAAYPIITETFSPLNQEYVMEAEFVNNDILILQAMKNTKLKNNTSNPQAVTAACAKFCAAQDLFFHNYDSDANIKINCYCMAEADNETSQTDTNGDPQTFKQTDSWLDALTPDDVWSNPDAQTVFRQENPNQGSNQEQYNINEPYDLFEYDPMTQTTGVRHKIAIIPTVDENLLCHYNGTVQIALTNGSERKLETIVINLTNQLQQTRINNKTLYVCTPPTDSFESTFSIQPSFDTLMVDDNVKHNLRQYFGDTIEPFESCNMIDPYSSSYRNYSNAKYNETDQPSKYSLPRSSSNAEKLAFTYFSKFRDQQTEIEVLRSQVVDKLDSSFYFTYFQEITQWFCFILVFLSIFDESNESLFVIQTNTRVFYVFSESHIPCSTLLVGFFMWLFMMLCNIIRIQFLCYKIIAIILLMNFGTTAEELMMNSLALIFILELDSVTYQWLFDTSKGQEFSCINFNKPFIDIKLFFNAKQYFVSYWVVNYMYNLGIYTYTVQNYNFLELIIGTFIQDTISLDTAYKTWLFTLGQILSFGFLVRELTVNLWRLVVNIRVHDVKGNLVLYNNQCTLSLMQLCMLVLVQCVIFAVTTLDFLFQAPDMLNCQKHNNINCANNLDLQSTVIYRNQQLVLMTPFWFLITLIFDFVIWICLEIGKLFGQVFEVPAVVQDLAQGDQEGRGEGLVSEKLSDEERAEHAQQQSQVARNELNLRYYDNFESQFKTKKQNIKNKVKTTEIQLIDLQISNNGRNVVSKEVFKNINLLTEEQYDEFNGMTYDIEDALDKYVKTSESFGKSDKSGKKGKKN